MTPKPPVERVVFAFAKPRMVVVTTPNREFNAKFESMKPGELRHADHRFEWTRAEFSSWAGRVAEQFSYRGVCTPSHLNRHDPHVL
jgi:hypothetical protein